MSLSGIDLNLLVVLDAVLAERSVARAARRLHVTPSAVSNALARLRAAIGDPLFTRSGRGIVPTPRAEELGPAVARALAELDRAVRGATFEPRSTRRTFTLAVSDAGQLVQAPRVAALLAEVMPLARLRVVGIDSLLALGGLAGTEVDVVLGVGERGTGIHVERVHDEPTVLVARRGHPALARRASRASLEALGHVAVDMAPGRGLRDRTGAAWARARMRRDVRAVVPSFAAAAAVVATTDLVATLPRSLFALLGPRLGLAVVGGPAPMRAVSMHLAWHERTHADPAMISFREIVRRACRGPASAPPRAR